MFSVVQYVMTLGTFALVVAVLWKILFIPLVASLDERQAAIAGDLSKAKFEREEMERLKADYDRQLREAHARVDLMIREATQSAQHAKEEMMTKAKEEAHDMLKKAEQKLADERNRVVREIRTEVVNLAIEAAERVIRQSVDQPVQKKMVEHFLKESDSVSV